MRSSRWSKILWVAALLPLFAASVLPAQLRTLICRVTGAVMEVESGCPAASMAQDPAQDPMVAAIPEGGSGSISEPGCCVVETIDLGRPLAEHGPEGTPPSSFTPVSATLTPRVGLAGRATPRGRQDRPPPAGPPLLLLKRSFLI